MENQYRTTNDPLPIAGAAKSLYSNLSSLDTKANTAPQAIDYASLGYTGPYALGAGDVVDPNTGRIKRADGFESAGPFQSFTNNTGNAYGNAAGLAGLQAADKKYQTGVVDSQSAKSDLSKIQTDFQSILTSLSNKQQYNQTGLNIAGSVVDLMKSKGIADTSAQARQQLAQQAGISDYNPNNTESNKKLADAIMNSKAVGTAMSNLTPGTPAYDTALSKVSGTIAGAIAPTQPQTPVKTEPLTSIGTKVSEDPGMAEYDRITAEIDKNNENITGALNQLRTGAIPLTADQEAVVNSTQQSFNNAIAQQKQANQSQENIVRQASFRSGSEYTPEVSSSIIKNVIDANVLKISEYDQQAIATIANLKQSFKEANYKNIKEGYDALQKTLKDKQENMLALMKLSHDYEKESLNYNLDVLKYKETVRSNMADEATAVQKAISSTGLSDPQKIAIFNRIVDKVNASPLVKAADRTPVLQSSVDLVKANPSDSTQQYNLSYAYTQALDTYQSAVREGELKNLNSIDSKIGSFKNSVEQMANGQIVRPEIALQIANASQTLIDAINSAAKAKVQSFKSQASVSGVGSEFDQYLGGVSQPYGNANNINTGGKLDVAAVKAQAEADAQANGLTGEAATQYVLKEMKDANVYNSSLSNVGSDTNKATGTTRAQKNNNPLNIKVSSFTQQFPGVSGTDPKPASDGGKFLTFNSPQDGFNAGVKLLKTPGYLNLDVEKAMRRWSGGAAGYGADVAPQFAGRLIKDLSDAELQTLIQSMAKREGYYA